VQVRLLKHWRGWKPNQVFYEMPEGQARVLLKRGVAVEHSPEASDDKQKKAAGPPLRRGKPKR
jgi:hypothetical protein